MFINNFPIDVTGCIVGSRCPDDLHLPGRQQDPIPLLPEVWIIKNDSRLLHRDCSNQFIIIIPDRPIVIHITTRLEMATSITATEAPSFIPTTNSHHSKASTAADE